MYYLRSNELKQSKLSFKNTMHKRDVLSILMIGNLIYDNRHIYEFKVLGQPRLSKIYFSKSLWNLDSASKLTNSENVS